MYIAICLKSKKKQFWSRFSKKQTKKKDFDIRWDKLSENNKKKYYVIEKENIKKQN